MKIEDIDEFFNDYYFSDKYDFDLKDNTVKECQHGVQEGLLKAKLTDMTNPDKYSKGELYYIGCFNLEDIDKIISEYGAKRVNYNPKHWRYNYIYIS